MNKKWKIEWRGDQYNVLERHGSWFTFSTPYAETLIGQHEYDYKPNQWRTNGRSYDYSKVITMMKKFRDQNYECRIVHIPTGKIIPAELLL